MNDAVDPIARLCDPHDERAALGDILIRPEHAEAYIAGGFSTALFRDARHRDIFAAIQALVDQGIPPDLLTVRRWLQDKRADIGDAYLMALPDGVPPQGPEHIAARFAHLDTLERGRRLFYSEQRLVAQLLENPAAINNGLLAHRIAELEQLHPQGPAGARPAPLVDDVAVLNLPEPSYLVDGRIPAGALMCLFGPPGIGKSFVAFDLALSLATASPWLEADIPTRGAVVYVVAEGAAGIAARVGAWKIAHGFSLEEAVGLHLWSGAVPLIDASRVASFIGAIKHLEPRLVVLDTLARCLVGADENSARDMGVAIDAADRIRTQLGASVLIVHHSNKSNGSERGSSALRGACDTMLELAAADDLLTLSCSKQKDAEPFPAIELRLVPAYPGAKSCVVRPASVVVDRNVNETLTDGQGKALHALRASFGDLGATGDEWQAVIPSMPRATFYRARKVLIDGGYVREVNRRFHVTGKRPSTPTGRETNRETDTPQSHANLTGKSHGNLVSHA